MFDMIYRNFTLDNNPFNHPFAWWLITCDSGTVVALTDNQAADEISMLCMGGEL